MMPKVPGNSGNSGEKRKVEGIKEGGLKKAEGKQDIKARLVGELKEKLGKRGEQGGDQKGEKVKGLETYEVGRVAGKFPTEGELRERKDKREFLNELRNFCKRSSLEVMWGILSRANLLENVVQNDEEEGLNRLEFDKFFGNLKGVLRDLEGAMMYFYFLESILSGGDERKQAAMEKRSKFLELMRGEFEKLKEGESSNGKLEVMLRYLDLARYLEDDKLVEEIGRECIKLVDSKGYKERDWRWEEKRDMCQWMVNSQPLYRWFGEEEGVDMAKQEYWIGARIYVPKKDGKSLEYYRKEFMEGLFKETFSEESHEIVRKQMDIIGYEALMSSKIKIIIGGEDSIKKPWRGYCSRDGYIFVDGNNKELLKVVTLHEAAHYVHSVIGSKWEEEFEVAVEETLGKMVGDGWRQKVEGLTKKQRILFEAVIFPMMYVGFVVLNLLKHRRELGDKDTREQVFGGQNRTYFKVLMMGVMKHKKDLGAVLKTMNVFLGKDEGRDYYNGEFGVWKLYMVIGIMALYGPDAIGDEWGAYFHQFLYEWDIGGRGKGESARDKELEGLIKEMSEFWGKCIIPKMEEYLEEAQEWSNIKLRGNNVE